MVDLVFTDEHDYEQFDEVPKLPGSFDEDDDDFAERVDLEYEQATEIEQLLEDAYERFLEEDDKREIVDIVMGEAAERIQDLFDRNGAQDSFWATDHFKCPRKRYYKMTGEDKTRHPGIRSEIKFKQGDVVGEVAAVSFAKAGLFYKREAYFRLTHDDLKYPTSGKCDVRFYDPTDGESISSAEVKSVSSKQFTEDKWWPQVDEYPRKRDVGQLHDYIYDHKTTEHLPDKDYGYLVYFDRNNGEFLVYRVFFNEALFNEMKYCDKYTEWWLERGVEPPRHPNGELALYKSDQVEPKGTVNPNESKFPCGGTWGMCSFADRCWADRIRTVADEDGPVIERLEEALDDG